MSRKPLIPYALTHDRKVRPIGIVAFPGVEALDITGPMEVFSFASLGLQREGITKKAVYTFEVLAEKPGPVKTLSGLQIIADRAYGDITNGIDTLLIPGGDMASVLGDRLLVDWIRAMAPRVRRLASVCTGAFLLAESGLLDGRKATTHWHFCNQLACKYPSIKVDADRIFVQDDFIFTSAGITSGIDLALAMVEEDWGRELALFVARFLVVFLKRPVDFYNGAMSTEQCYRLRDAFLAARTRPTKVIVLFGGRDFWSNGIHLNVIEAAPDPAMESWRNINAIDDLIYEILNTMSHLVVAGLRGNAGAGGAMLALAADYVYARRGVVLNPHYKSMGGLYGSEYHTYTLPRRVGPAQAAELTECCLPLGTKVAKAMGFLDGAFGDSSDEFEQEMMQRVTEKARDPRIWRLLREKHEKRLAGHCIKPLAVFRAEELKKMRTNFFGPDPAYHVARQRFVYKGAPVSRVQEKTERQPVPIRSLRAVA